jgi:putative ABC transport system ATP-binding protein
MMIKLEGVEKYYGINHILKSVDLEVSSGEFIAVVGSSGSGKSTLLNLIGGMDRPEEGKIFVGSDDITRFSDERLTLYRRKEVGFIFQFFNLLPSITIFENIQMPLLLNGLNDEEKVAGFIRRVGLKGKEERFPYQLSGGEQQRVAIARALVHDPGLILADEPTGSLDSRTGREIMDLIKELAAETRKTVILVTHEQYLTSYAGRTVSIHDGRLSS